MDNARNERVPVSTKSPGVEHGGENGISGYVMGLGISILLTLASFWAATSGLIWGPAAPVMLTVLAIAQMLVHLLFFLHINTAPDHGSNVLALAFALLIIALVVIGSLWIMANLNANMMPMEELLKRQR